MKAELEKEGILKEEKIMYFKSKANALQGHIYLTPNRLVVDAHKTGVGGMGLLGAILKKKVEEKNYGFEVERGKIAKIEKGKFGVHKNILQITDAEDNVHRVAVKNFSDWEQAINNQ